MPIEKLIVVEDDLIVRKNLEQQLRSRRYDVAAVDTLKGAREYLPKDNWDLLLVDLKLPDGEGTELLQEVNDRPDKPLVVMMSGFGSIESAVECMRQGAFDYLIKPVSKEQIDAVLNKAEKYNQLVKVNQYLAQEQDESTGYELLGKSHGMEHLRGLIRRVARANATVLIQGESGTGKELVARAIYKQSPRRDQPFIKINCAAVPENLIESEFFGHEKGAFTGALSRREGRFELAHNGTILLDEVSEVAPTVQAKLLRVLQERELERVGGNRTIKVDVRVIATTNRQLEESVERKEFRQDLFFRLNVVPIHVPPLRDRKEDIVFLAEQFMHRFARKHGVRVQGLSSDCKKALEQHEWPGNVRELQNVLERAVILSGDGELISQENLGLSGLSLPDHADSVTEPASTGGATTFNRDASGELLTLAELEKRHIFSALKQCDNNRTHAAKLLQISIRTLRNKLNEYAGKSKPGDSEDLPEEFINA